MKPSIAARIAPLLEKLRPQLSKIQALTQTKQGRIQLGGAAAGVLLLLILMMSGGEEERPVVVINQKPAVVEKPVPPAPPNTDNSRLILELFSPNDATLGAQRNATTITQQIEQTLTVSFVLVKCLALSQDDYTRLFHALVIYAERSKLAPNAAEADKIVRQIAQSSNASYALVYSRTSCNSPQLAPLANDVVKWTKAVLSQE